METSKDEKFFIETSVYIGTCFGIIITLITMVLFLISLLQTKENEIENWKMLYELSQPDTTHYDYKKGDVIYPDYLFPDPLQVIESFNIPDSCITDQQIYDLIMSKTEVL
jgi:H+/gluconate symporter-like permease